MYSADGAASSAGGGPGLLDPSVLHHHEGVGAVGGDGEVVGDQEDSSPGRLAQLVDEVQHRGLDGDVQGAGGFVGDQQVGLQREGSGDEHPLAHAAGELVGVLAGTDLRIVEAHLVEQLDHARLDAVLVAPPVDTQGLSDARADRAHRVQGAGGVLRDEADPGAAQLAPGPFGQAHELLRYAIGTGEGDGASGDAAVVGQQADRGLRGGGLPGAGFTDQSGDLATVDGEVDPAHRLDLAPAGAVGDGQVGDRQQRLRPTAPAGCEGSRWRGASVGAHARSLVPMASLRRLVDSTTAATTTPGSRVSHQAVAT